MKTKITITEALQEVKTIDARIQALSVEAEFVAFDDEGRHASSKWATLQTKYSIIRVRLYGLCFLISSFNSSLVITALPHRRTTIPPA